MLSGRSGWVVGRPAGSDLAGGGAGKEREVCGSKTYVREGSG